MDYQTMLKKLDKWVRVIQNSIIVLAVIETIVVLFIGLASNKVTDQNTSDFWVYLLIFLSVIYALATVLKIAYNKAFPSSITEELNSKHELKKVRN